MNGLEIGGFVAELVLLICWGVGCGERDEDITGFALRVGFYFTSFRDFFLGTRGFGMRWEGIRTSRGRQYTMDMEQG